jgi:hypothetical protein
VPEVVKADGVGETRLVEERLEGAAGDIVAVEGVPMVEVKTRPWSCQSPASFSRAHLTDALSGL